MCIFYFWFYFTLVFFVFFCLWQEGGERVHAVHWPQTPSVSSDQQTVQDGGPALLQPTIVQCCWCVEKKRLCSFFPGPFLGMHSTRPCY